MLLAFVVVANEVIPRWPLLAHALSRYWRITWFCAAYLIACHATAILMMVSVKETVEPRPVASGIYLQRIIGVTFIAILLFGLKPKKAW